MLNLQVRLGSAEQEVVEEFLKYLLCVIKEKGYVEKQVFYANRTDLFYKDAGK